MIPHIDRARVGRPIRLRRAIREAGIRCRLTAGVDAWAIMVQVVFAERADDEHGVIVDVADARNHVLDAAIGSRATVKIISITPDDAISDIRPTWVARYSASAKGSLVA